MRGLNRSLPLRCSACLEVRSAGGGPPPRQRPVLDAARYHVQIARAQPHRTISELDDEAPLQDEEKVVRLRMRMSDERAFRLDDHYVVSVELGDDPRRPMIRKGTELFGKVYGRRHARCSGALGRMVPRRSTGAKLCPHCIAHPAPQSDPLRLLLPHRPAAGSSPASKRPVRDRIADLPSFTLQAAHSHRPTSSGNLTKPFSCNSIKCQIASGAAALTDLRNERSPFRRRMLAQGAFRDPIRCARLQKSRLHRHGSRRSAGPKGWKRNGQR